PAADRHHRCDRLAVRPLHMDRDRPPPPSHRAQSRCPDYAGAVHRRLSQPRYRHEVYAERRTSTSNFGVGRRESHDASQFYARFRPPVIDDDDAIATAPDLGDGCILGDIRERGDDDLPDNSVALVVTSPPYFAGKEYEEALGQGQIPASYREFLDM